MDVVSFESILDQIEASETIGKAAGELASQKNVDENESTDEPSVENYEYVIRILTINVNKSWNETVESKVEYVCKYVTEITFRFEEFLATYPKVKRHSKLYFYRRPDVYRMPDEIEKMVTRPRGFSSDSSDYLEVVFGLDYNSIRKPRDLFMLSALLDKLAWGSSFFVEYMGNSIAAKDKKCLIDHIIPLYNMMLKENGIEKWKDTDSFEASIESYVNNAYQFFGQSVEICETVRKMFQYDPSDNLVTAALNYRSYGSSRKCDTPKFLEEAIENNYIDADYLCNSQEVTFRITSSIKRDSVQISSWRLRFIWDHVEKALKKNPRKITNYIMRIYDRNYVRFAFYLGLFQGIEKEDLDFDLKTTVNDVCVVVDFRWERMEFWNTLASILGIKEGFSAEDVSKFLKKLDRQIYFVFQRNFRVRLSKNP